MKFKVGDKVRVRKGLTVGAYYDMDDGSASDTFEGRMLHLADKTMVVHAMLHGKYLLKGDDTGSLWTDGMLEPEVIENANEANKDVPENEFEPSDIVVCVRPCHSNVCVLGERGTVICKDPYALNAYIVEFNAFVDGHDADGRGRNGHCWSCDAQNLRLVDRVKPSKFNVGDRVKCVTTREGESLKGGKVGTVIAHSIVKKVPLVEFDENVGGHNGRYRAERNGKDGHCWYCRDNELKAIPANEPSDNVSPLKAGVRVKFSGNSYPHLQGELGTIIGQHKDSKYLLVEFDARILGGHAGCSSCNVAGREGHCWFCDLADLEIITDETCESAFNQKIVITSDGYRTVASLIEDDAIVKVAEATMPDGVDFNFIGTAKRALKRLAKDDTEPKLPEVVPPLFNGTLVCIENMLGKDAFTIGKTYNAVDGVVVDDNGNRYEPINWLNDDPTSGFCVCDTYEGRVAKFVVLTDSTKAE